MRSINLLFLIVFFSTVNAGCGTIYGSRGSLAPVETGIVSENIDKARSAALQTPQKAMVTAPAIVRPPTASHETQPSRSPDALFVALASLGIDDRYGGRSPTTGFDCSGLVAHIYRDAYGLNLPAHTAAQSRLGKSIDLAQLETGDLVFYNTQGQANTHVGIYIGDERFIHAPRTGAAVRIESMRSAYWRTRFSGARRIVI